MFVALRRVHVAASDFSRSRRFYGETLGLPEVGGFEKDWVEFGLGPVLVKLTPLRPGEVPARNQVALTLSTADIEGTLTALKERGVTVTRGPLEEFTGRSAEILDPDGYRIVVFQPSDLHPDEEYVPMSEVDEKVKEKLARLEGQGEGEGPRPGEARPRAKAAPDEGRPEEAGPEEGGSNRPRRSPLGRPGPEEGGEAGPEEAGPEEGKEVALRSSPPRPRAPRTRGALVFWPVMSTALIDYCRTEIEALKEARTYKKELVLEGPTGARVRVDGREVVMLTSNNYLGFANHPRVVEAAKKAIDRWGNGLGSVRFICGTQELHKELEAEIAAFFGTDDTILYMSCWNANEGLFQPLLDEADAILGRAQPRLDHRRRPPLQGEALRPAARRPRRVREGARRVAGPAAPPHHDRRRLLDGGRGRPDPRARRPLREARHAPRRRRLARDGRPRRDRPRHGGGAGVHGKVAVFTTTLGKAMGSAAGGFTTGPAALVELLRQRSRTNLFSNSLPPAVTARSLEAFRMLMEDPTPVAEAPRERGVLPEGDHRGGLQDPARESTRSCRSSSATRRRRSRCRRRSSRRASTSRASASPSSRRGRRACAARSPPPTRTADLDQAVDAFKASGREFGVV